jgi:hypothetical protein
MHISRIALALAAASSLLLPATAAAYTAVGDRIFPAKSCCLRRLRATPSM